MKTSGGKRLPPDVFCFLKAIFRFTARYLPEGAAANVRMALKSSPMQNFFAAATLHNRGKNVFLIFFANFIKK